MSKRLYPKPKPERSKKFSPPKENMLNRPYHVFYSDPNETVKSEWRHYNSELAVKADAWYQCRLLGFRPSAVLYSRDELRAE